MACLRGFLVYWGRLKGGCSRIFLGCSRRVAWLFNKILGRGGVSFTCASGTSNLERF